PQAKPAASPDARKLQELLPAGPPPVPALVKLDDQGRLVVRERQVFVEPRTEIIPPDKLVTSYHRADRMVTGYHDLTKTRASDTSGKPIDAKQLPRLLRKEILALVSHIGPGLDPLHMRFYKEGTLVFELPMIPPPPVVAVPAAPPGVILPNP